MYRYGQPSRPSRSKYLQTLVYLLLLGLTIASVSLSIAYNDASRVSGNTRTVLITRFKSEVSQAKTRASQLLSTGGSKTESMVATVRQHVYAARTINEMTTNIYGAGNMLVSETFIKNCLDLLDLCDTKIQSGLVVTDTYTSLRVAIDDLYGQAAELQ